MQDNLKAALMAKRLMDQAAGARPSVIQGRVGPGLLYRGVAIHNPDEPLMEARNWVGQALSQRLRQTKPPSLALVLGLGLGWHLRVIKEMFPSIKVCVFEPDKSLIDTFEKYNVLALGQEPQIYEDFSSFEELVAQEVVHGEGGIPLVVRTPAYAALWPKEAARFDQRLAMEISRREVIDKTKELTNSAFIENLAKNTGLTTKLPDLMLLRNRINSRAAFIVGAGPSLAENGRLLSEVGPKGFIICAAAALKPLLSLGVSPDIILVLESSDTSSYLTLNEVERQILKNEVVLAAASGSHPNHFKVDGFIKAIFHLNGGEAQLLGRGLFLPQGGNAGTAAFALAYVWGMSPLILVGQDQAYHGQLLHAPGTVDNVSEIDRATVVTIPAIGGGFAETNTSLLASINWYAEAANSIKRKSVQPKLINSTFRGAALKGFEEISLDEVLRNLGPEPNPISLKAMLSALPKPSAKEIRGDLRQMSALVSSLKSVLQVNFQRCINEMMNASKASAFLAHILAPALASGHRAGALKNLIWADGIILKMLASL